MTKNRDELTELDFDDPIEWVYEVRRRISEEYGHDIARYINALREKERQNETNGIHTHFVKLPIVRQKPVVA